MYLLQEDGSRLSTQNNDFLIIQGEAAGVTEVDLGVLHIALNSQSYDFVNLLISHNFSPWSRLSSTCIQNFDALSNSIEVYCSSLVLGSLSDEVVSDEDCIIIINSILGPNEGNAIVGRIGTQYYVLDENLRDDPTGLTATLQNKFKEVKYYKRSR